MSSRCLPALFALIVGGSKYFLGVWYYTPVVLASATDSRNTHRPSVFSSVPSVCTSCCAFLLCTTFLLHSRKTAPYLSSSLCLYLLNFSTWGNADFISFLGRRKRWRRGYKKKRVKKKKYGNLFFLLKWSIFLCLMGFILSDNMFSVVKKQPFSCKLLKVQVCESCQNILCCSSLLQSGGM